jgi:hypothetical protein
MQRYDQSPPARVGLAPGLTFLWIAAQGSFYFQKLMSFPAASSTDFGSHLVMRAEKKTRLGLASRPWQIGE